MLTHLTQYLSPFSAALDAIIPNPNPEPPPGNAATELTKIIGMIKWGAGAALVACFFAGVIAFAAGRVLDHHNSGRRGTTMILASFGGALLYAVGYTLITTFAGS